MFRTADPLPQRQIAATRLVLAVLIGCLMLHFLVEDLVLFTEMSAATQTSSNVTPLTLAEMDHLDDLAVLTEQPARIAPSALPLAYVWPIPLAKQTHLPILHPPKI